MFKGVVEGSCNIGRSQGPNEKYHCMKGKLKAR